MSKCVAGKISLLYRTQSFFSTAREERRTTFSNEVDGEWRAKGWGWWIHQGPAWPGEASWRTWWWGWLRQRAKHRWEERKGLTTSEGSQEEQRTNPRQTDCHVLQKTCRASQNCVLKDLWGLGWGSEMVNYEWKMLRFGPLLWIAMLNTVPQGLAVPRDDWICM